jgi:hypothetical protein
MSSELSLDANMILDRLKSALEVETDTELAQIFGLQQSSLASWRSRDRLNHRKIIALCNNKGISLDWLYGFEQHAPEGISATTPAQQDELETENERLNEKVTSLEGRIEGLREALRLMGVQEGGGEDEGAQSSEAERRRSEEDEVGFTATGGADAESVG